MFKEKGFKGFYQGGTATLVRDVFFSAVYFPMFATFNQMVNLDPKFKKCIKLMDFFESIIRVN